MFAFVKAMCRVLVFVAHCYTHPSVPFVVHLNLSTTIISCNRVTIVLIVYLQSRASQQQAALYILLNKICEYKKKYVSDTVGKDWAQSAVAQGRPQDSQQNHHGHS